MEKTTKKGRRRMLIESEHGSRCQFSERFSDKSNAYLFQTTLEQYSEDITPKPEPRHGEAAVWWRAAGPLCYYQFRHSTFT